MALKITDQNGVFMIEGSINTTTSESFRDHFKSIIDQNKKVIINIDKVNQIDVNGLSVLREFYL